MKIGEPLLLALALVVAVLVTIASSSPTVQDAEGRIASTFEKRLTRAVRARSARKAAASLASPASNPEMFPGFHQDHQPTRANLIETCEACAAFVPALVKLVDQHAAAIVPLPHSVADSAREAHEESVRDLCMSADMPDRFVRPCQLVAEMYGLENVHQFLAAAPDLVCETVQSCTGIVDDEDASRQFETVGDTLITSLASHDVAAAGADSDADGDVLVAAGQESNVLKSMSGMMQHRYVPHGSALFIASSRY